MKNFAKIKKGDEFFDEANGTLYRVIGKHHSDFECLETDEYDEEIDEYINFKRCILTASKMRSLANAKAVMFEEETEE